MMVNARKSMRPWRPTGLIILAIEDCEATNAPRAPASKAIGKLTIKALVAFFLRFRDPSCTRERTCHGTASKAFFDYSGSPRPETGDGAFRNSASTMDFWTARTALMKRCCRREENKQSRVSRIEDNFPGKVAASSIERGKGFANRQTRAIGMLLGVRNIRPQEVNATR